MRKLGTVLVVAAVAAVAVAALVDAVTGGAEEASAPAASGGRATPAAVARTAPVPVPDCRPGQLALAIDEAGTTWEVVMSHVQGARCRARDLTLEILITDRTGETTSLPLGDERILDDEYSAEYVRSVPFSVCQEGAPFAVEARAGRYRATGTLPARSGINCHSARHVRRFRMGTGPDADRFFFEALDAATHTFTVRVELPHRADVSVEVVTASGLTLRILDRSRRSDCRRRGRQDVCLVQYGLLPTEGAGTWTVIVHKRSHRPALVRVSTGFVEPRGP